MSAQAWLYRKYLLFYNNYTLTENYSLYVIDFTVSHLFFAQVPHSDILHN